MRLPSSRLAILQVLEYFRAFLIGRVGWSHMNALLIVSGAFVHASTDSGCKFCHYGPACGRNAIKRASTKMADTNLDAMRRLMAHE